MVVNGLDLRLIDSDFNENKAEKDAEETPFYKDVNEHGITFYQKSKTDPSIVYAFNCTSEPDVWCVLVQRFEIVK